jgi:ArsR family transcriptional regulator
MNIVKMERSARRAADFLKTVANDRRLLILCHLAEGEMCVSELEVRLDMRQPHLSQHLARLRRDGFVRVRRDGREIFYRIASPEALRVIGLLYEMFCPEGGKRGARARASTLRSTGTQIGKKPAKRIFSMQQRLG